MKLWAALSILAVGTTLVVGTLFITKTKLLTTPPTQVNNQLESVNVNVALTPQSASINTGNDMTYTVTLDAGSKGIQGFETYLTFDPKLITITSIEPGALLEKPDVLAKEIDSTGKISYALGSLKTASGKGTAFIINVKTTAPTQGQQNVLLFDRSKTKIALVSENRQKHYIEDETVVTYNETPLTILPQVGKSDTNIIG